MEQKAFELIQEKLQAALNEQGFGEAVALETDNGRGVMFTTGEVAYGLFYETKQRRFVLRSATMKTPKEPGDWRQQIGRASVGKECRSRWSPYH